MSLLLDRVALSVTQHAERFPNGCCNDWRRVGFSSSRDVEIQTTAADEAQTRAPVLGHAARSFTSAHAIISAPTRS